jgi:hypothetical protein
MTTRNDKATLPADVPDAIQWAVNAHNHETMRLAKIDRDIEVMTQKIGEYETYLAEVTANRAGAQTARNRVAANAQIVLEMAETACKTYGYPMPEAQGEPPLNDTSAFPAVSPDGATQVIPAVPWFGVQLRQVVTVHRKDGRSFRGEVTHMSPELLVLGIGGDPDLSEFAPGEVDRIEMVNKLDAKTLRDHVGLPALPWSHVHAGQHVNVYWADGGYLSGTVEYAGDTFVVDTSEHVYTIPAADIKSVEPTDLAQVAKTQAERPDGEADHG